MTATKQCPSCHKQWSADAPYCGYCATSLHNVQVQSASSSVSASLHPPQSRIDDEYMTMFRAPQAPDGIAVAHLYRVDTQLLWAHVQRLTVAVWVRYVLVVLCVGVGLYALVTFRQLPDGSDWSGWHLLCVGAILAGIYLFTSALVIQAQRDMMVHQLRSHDTEK